MESIEVLAGALKLEQEGLEFYRRMAEASRDPELADTFKQLIADEEAHARYIRRQYEALQAGNAWVDMPELTGGPVLDSADPVFPKDKAPLEVLPAGATEEDALLFALGIEDKSYRLYRRCSQEVQDLGAQRWFAQLATAELGHFNVLMARYESRYGYPR